MSEAAVTALIDAEKALIDALDRDEIEPLEAAVRVFARAVEDVQAAGAWHATPELSEKIKHALKLAEAAAGRVNFLSDRNRRRLDMLSGAAGKPRATAYTRHGRMLG
jgi:hypothetical protein